MIVLQIIFQSKMKDSDNKYLFQEAMVRNTKRCSFGKVITSK